MSRTKWLSIIFALPVLVGIWVIVSAIIHGKGRRHVLIPVEALQHAEKAWTDFGYIPVSNRDLRIPAIERLVSENAILSEKQKQVTAQLIDDVLLAYGTSNWEKLFSFRFPSEHYKISGERAKSISEASHALSTSSSNSLEQYKQIWLKTFAVPLWNEVAFFDSSLTITNLSNIEGFSFDFPDFVSKTNQNWMEQGLSSSFDFSDRLKELLDSHQKVQFMRLCFLGNLQIEKLNEKRPFMFVFFWDSSVDRWMPWRFENAFVRKPIHAISFF